MFVVMTRYLEEFGSDDPRLQAHREFLGEQIAAGRLVASGPRKPRVGGLTIYNMTDEHELRELLEREPLYVAGMLEFELFEFIATLAADESYLDPSVTGA